MTDERWCSRWLAAARWDAGLLVPGRPRWQAADLRLGSDGVGLAAGRHRASVPWDVPSIEVAELTRSRWGTPLGVALQVGGAAAPLVADVHRARRRLVHRFERATPTIPLRVGGNGRHGRLGDDRGGLGILVRLLVERPELRPRLADRAVVERLLADLRGRPHGLVHRPEGARRLTFEVLAALGRAGLVHPVGGRPLPGDPVPTTDEATATVLARLAASPYTRDLDLDPAEVRRLVEQHHTGIAPWPFEALLL